MILWNIKMNISNFCSKISKGSKLCFQHNTQGSIVSKNYSSPFSKPIPQFKTSAISPTSSISTIPTPHLHLYPPLQPYLPLPIHITHSQICPSRSGQRDSNQPLIKSSLGWQLSTPPKSNRSCKNIRNPKISIFLWHCSHLQC